MPKSVMDRSAFLETLTCAEFPDLVCGVKLVQLLCQHSKDTARKTFREKMQLPLMQQCSPPSLATDGHTHLIDKQTACLLITKLPDGKKGGRHLNPAGQLQAQFGKLLFDVFGGDTMLRTKALDGIEARMREVATTCTAADMVWHLLEWAQVTVTCPKDPLPSCGLGGNTMISDFVRYWLCLAFQLLQRLEPTATKEIAFTPDPAAVAILAKRKLSGHSWQCSRMSLEVRRLLAEHQLKVGPGLTPHVLKAILVSQLICHNDRVFRNMSQVFTAASLAEACAGHQGVIPNLEAKPIILHI